MTVIRDCTYLVRVDEEYLLAYGDIVVRDGIIAEIAKPNAAPVAGQSVMSGTGCLVVPGLSAVLWPRDLWLWGGTSVS